MINNAQVDDSTTGYRQEIRAAQPRQAPLSSSQLTTGTLSQAAIVRPQLRQWDRGATIDSPAGSRTIQTFRKLPSSNPQRPKRRQITLAAHPQADRLHWSDER